MTYHKRPAVTRNCAHCRTKFESTHKSRLYCCQSCNTLAWRARQATAVAPTQHRAQAGEPGPPSLALTAQNVGVLALGNLAAQGTVAVFQHLGQGGSSPELLLAEVRQLRQDLGLAPAVGVPKGGALPPAVRPLPPKVEPPRTFLPPALAAATAPVQRLAIGGHAPRPFVRLVYCGHVLYYHAAQQLLYWEQAPGIYHQLVTGRLLTQLAARPGQAVVTLASAPGAEGVPLVPANEKESAALVARQSAALAQERAAEAQAEAAFARALHEVASAPSSPPCKGLG